MTFFPDFAPNSRKEWRVSLFHSNLRKQIRKLPKILKSVKIIQYCSILFIRVLRLEPRTALCKIDEVGRGAGHAVEEDLGPDVPHRGFEGGNRIRHRRWSGLLLGTPALAALSQELLQYWIFSGTQTPPKIIPLQPKKGQMLLSTLTKYWHFDMFCIAAR